MIAIDVGTWVRILDGPHIGRRGMVLAVRGPQATVQVERLENGRLPTVSVAVDKLRPAGKQSVRSVAIWGAGVRVYSEG